MKRASLNEIEVNQSLHIIDFYGKFQVGHVIETQGKLRSSAN
jgi:hypothetical protein